MSLFFNQPIIWAGPAQFFLMTFLSMISSDQNEGWGNHDRSTPLSYAARFFICIPHENLTAASTFPPQTRGIGFDEAGKGASGRTKVDRNASAI